MGLHLFMSVDVGRRMGGHLELPASEAVRARDGEATAQ